MLFLFFYSSRGVPSPQKRGEKGTDLRHLEHVASEEQGSAVEAGHSAGSLKRQILRFLPLADAVQPQSAKVASRTADSL